MMRFAYEICMIAASIKWKLGNDEWDVVAHTDIFDSFDWIVADIERVKLLTRFQVFDASQQILVQIKWTEFHLCRQATDLLQPITLEPQAFETCVCLQVLNVAKTCQQAVN